MAIEANDPPITVSRQCELLGLSRSSCYYRSHDDDADNEHLMRVIDQLYTEHPFYGVGMMTRHLRRLEHVVNPKRIRRLMRLMGLESLAPKPGLSLANKAHRVYPYLLTGMTIDRPNQVWATDITYIPMHRGWVYLAAIMDWYSRYVITWELSVTLDASFCVDALDRALITSGGPEIFNTDQGSQFTSDAFTGRLKESGVKISMDGKGRAYDNIFVERLWRSVKYEEVYLHDYQTVAEAMLGLGRYFGFYNHQRPHTSLDDRTPAEVYGAWAGVPGRAAKPTNAGADEYTLTHPDTRPAHGEYLTSPAEQ